MGNRVQGGAPTSAFAQSLAAGLPQHIDWQSLLPHVFDGENRALLLLTDAELTQVIAGQQRKVVQAIFSDAPTGEQRDGDGSTVVSRRYDSSITDGRVGLVSQRGLKAGPNQDSAFFLSFVDRDGSDVWMGCVADGHGPAGHDMSALLVQWLPLLVLRDPALAAQSGRIIPNDPQAVFDGIAAAFRKLGPVMARASNQTMEDQFSGTTAVFALCAHGVIHTANVGDSRAVLGCPASALEGSPSSRQAADARSLTRDHSLTDALERRRIESQGGKVQGNRVWTNSPPYVGLNMSRSFGDVLLHSAGVSDVADVAGCFLDDRSDQFVMLASDGIWEHFSSEQSVDCLASCLQRADAQDAAATFTRQATEVWRQRTEGGSRDDITVLLISPAAIEACPGPARTASMQLHAAAAASAAAAAAAAMLAVPSEESEKEGE
eukprot:TRINITY_DN74933_c0_g1_i1.p1 TRINITY_DN74933_c0_g1~~TRINITY_DN74933_c0_g1_i1.p1  ORF type:complete len:434 (+),score=85.59 TRINITY_DN74933_c0_g1_i1:159-1460(+)